MSKTVEWYQPGVDKDKGGKLPVGFVTPVQELDESGEEGEDDAEDESESANDNMEEDEGIQDDDDDGWITPSNFKNKRMEMLGADTNNDDEDEESEEIIVACLTSDFAMQNVLKQLHLNVLSTDGLLIKETKTWILRCYACFKTTPKMDKKFCPSCGNKTLKRVSVTLNADGTQQIHISTRKALSKRGKKFSLPKPQGGKYAVNPILSGMLFL